MSIRKNLSISLLRFKRENNLSFIALADLLGIPLSSAQNYCSEKVNPRTDTVELISQATDIPMIELVCGELSGEALLEAAVYIAELTARLPPEERKKVVRAVIVQYTAHPWR